MGEATGMVQLEELLDSALRVEREAHRSNALLWYEPANPALAGAHQSLARTVGVFGGNRSGKSEFGLVEVAILATGVVPRALQSTYPKAKLRGDAPRGVRIRVVCTDFVNGIAKIILPKLRDGDEHHGPWIPKHSLINGSWEQSWNEKQRTLRVQRDLWWGSGRRLTDWSTIEMMSYDQETPRFSGTSRHLTLFDELPPHDVWTECQMRHMDVGGRSLITLTPPDTTGDIAWIFDDIYEVGQPAHPRYDPKRIQCFTIFTEHNIHLDPGEVDAIRTHLSPDETETRLHGAFRHLAGLVYPQFRTFPDADGTLHVVEPMEVGRDWPIVMVIDPHPRTPWAIIWAAVDPQDTLWVFDELWGGADTIEGYAKLIKAKEQGHGRPPVVRVIDPAANQSIGTVASEASQRSFTIRRGLDAQGIRCKEARNDFGLGRSRLIEMLRPGPMVGPRMQVFRSCTQVIYQMTHHIWAEYGSQAIGHDPKQMPQERNKHFPDLLRYLAMEDPRYGISHRLQPIQWRPAGPSRSASLVRTPVYRVP